jgi:phosphohistidine swiveling domain-containing protein
MKKANYKKEDFLPSGSGELLPIYFRSSAIGAAASVSEPAFFCFIDGVGHSFVFKEGIIRLKNKLLDSKYKDLEKEFKLWKKKWDSLDEELYAIATDKPENYKKNWRRLDEISRELWVESYKVETLDNYAEEIENLLARKMKEKRIDANLLHEIISPNCYTRIQETIQDRKKVLDGKMPSAQYLRKHWFAHGNWAGGELMTKKLLKNDLEDVAAKTDFVKRGKIQARAERLLDKKTINLIKIIRLLSLWREERKANSQKYCLGYKEIIKALSKDLSLDKKIVEWLLYEDLGGKLNQKKIMERKKRSVILFDPKFPMGVFMPKIEAEKILKEFFSIKKVSEIRGMVASRGKVRGKVCLVLKNEDFPKFSEGEILVTGMTRPEFLPLMKKALAIITDDGGITCHAAIISRELKKPCIIGTKIATKVLHDGDWVEVDANEGIVKILKRG